MVKRSEYNITKKRSSPYHPEGDGISERQIQTMKGLFRTKLNAKNLPANRWPELLPDVQLAMNNKTHTATKFAPAELMFGKKLRRGDLAVTGQLDGTTPQNCSQEVLAEETLELKDQNIEKAQSNLKKAAERMKQSFDKHLSIQEIKMGDQALVKKNAVDRGESRKLGVRFHQPSEVIEVNMPLLRIRNKRMGKLQWRHHN